jgi:putative ABC transport system permease protein
MFISFQYTAKEMLANRTRLYLTLLALACGTAAIAFMLSLGQGLREQFMKQSNVGRFNLSIEAGKTILPYRGMPVGTPIYLSNKDTSVLKQAIPEIKNVLTSYSVSQNITYGNSNLSSTNSYSRFSIKAVSPGFDQVKHLTTQPGGRFFNDADDELKSPVIVLGNQLATQLFSHFENPIGKIVQLGGKPFTVIGVTESKQTGSSISNSPGLSAWIPGATYESLVPNAHNMELIIVPSSIDQVEAIKKHLSTVLARYHHFDPNDTSAIHIWDRNSFYKERLLLLTALQLLLGIIGGITLAMASVSVANVMFAAIDNATREIGIKIALGAQRYHILSYYLFEGLLVTAIGGALGILISLLLTFGYNHLFETSKSGHNPAASLANIQASLSFSVLLTVVLVLGLVGFLAGFFPARKAASVDPVEALKHE